ncbi:neutral zinc metallopeptidase [Nocardioides sp.]|uniref:KPN_02809 family neutral zinc metallopeptidase n=1 Tax=Nocardioides sp. TaxID=35761 RepID=UPI0039E70DDD
MRFNPKARLDTSRTSDAGSGSGGGGLGGGIPLPTGKMGAGGVVVLLVLVLLGQCTGTVDLGSVLGGSTSGASLNASRFQTDASAGDDRYASCTTGEDANNSSDCALVAVENSLYDFWSEKLGSKFQAEQGVVTFTGGVQTQGCGSASSDMGPFYCPVDQTIYLDTQFYTDIFEGQLGGEDAPFVRAYVIAHEYGHHIQNLLGYMSQVKTQQGPTSDSVRLELQADCFAGVWAAAAESTPDEDGNTLIEDITDEDITEAIGAATTVGDDYIQQRMGGATNPEGWTHGSSEQRVKWFKTGMSAQSLDECDTFSATSL